MEVVFSDIVDIYNEIKKNTRNKKKLYQFEMFKMENVNVNIKSHKKSQKLTFFYNLHIFLLMI